MVAQRGERVREPHVDDVARLPARPPSAHVRARLKYRTARSPPTKARRPVRIPVAKCVLPHAYNHCPRRTRRRRNLNTPRSLRSLFTCPQPKAGPRGCNWCGAPWWSTSTERAVKSERRRELFGFSARLHAAPPIAASASRRPSLSVSPGARPSLLRHVSARRPRPLPSGCLAALR